PPPRPAHSRRAPPPTAALASSRAGNERLMTCSLQNKSSDIKSPPKEGSTLMPKQSTPHNIEWRIMDDLQITPYLKVPGLLADHFIGQLNELVRQANELQPPSANEFSKGAAAIHEASHCVVFAREGDILKSARILPTGTCWLVQTIPIPPVDETQWISPLDEPHRWLSFLRRILAGRRGELLLERPFCLRAGLDELAYAQITVMMVFPALKLDKEDYPRLW